MHITKAILLLSCLLLLESSVSALNFDGILDCTQAAIESGVSLAARVIPEVKRTTACINFVPSLAAELDAQSLVLLIYDFFKQFLANEKCVDATLERVYAAVQPELQKLYNIQCIPTELLEHYI
ncbi:uncharacterized protein LOC26527400 isoform X1 [Drosophila mojavensis]|uniref:uncharacterized protein LOC26527400 isoform X1 n=1 Tax=Drosophila mojavensis TaxID=7230 RepID=UPI0013EE5B3B|nr:uncharacterized protein LOC26527400 isoform X1 [Drosophila mojavensis]